MKKRGLHAFSRTELLLGPEGLDRLRTCRVAIFGVGGVGSFVVEGLVRSGLGHFVLVDDDAICLTNLNRQLHATRKTVGKPKVEAMRDRILEINPKADVRCIQTFYAPGLGPELVTNDLDYVVDCIDTVTCKLDLVQECHRRGIPIISAMGAGNKLDPTAFEVSDISKTTVCPLARTMRKELRKRGIRTLKVVYSREEPLAPEPTEGSDCAMSCICPKGTTRHCTERRTIPGSVAFVPSVMGLILAGEVIKDLLKTPMKPALQDGMSFELPEG